MNEKNKNEKHDNKIAVFGANSNDKSRANSNAEDA